MKGEQVRIASKGTDNLDAYLKTLQARYYSNKGTREGNTKAKQLVDEAIATAPDYAYAYRILGLTHIRDFYLGMSQSPKKSIKLAMAAYKKAVALDESLASAWAGVGYVLVLMRNYEEAVRLGKKAIAQEPNGLIAHLMLAVAASLGGFDEDAQAAAKEILRIDPQFSVKRLKAPFKDKIHMQIACDALNKAGLSLDCDALK